MLFCFGCLAVFCCFLGEQKSSPKKCNNSLYINMLRRFWDFQAVQKLYFYPLYFCELYHKNKGNGGTWGTFFKNAKVPPALWHKVLRILLGGTIKIININIFLNIYKKKYKNSIKNIQICKKHKCIYILINRKIEKFPQKSFTNPYGIRLRELFRCSPQFPQKILHKPLWHKAGGTMGGNFLHNLEFPPILYIF